MQFDFDVATERDDSAIRTLLANNPMPGLVTVAFEREPRYFAGHGVMGDPCLTLKARDRKTGKLAGILSIASAERSVNGQVESVGYLGQARIDKEFRGYLLPMRSFAYLKRQVDSGWPRVWFCAIVEENPSARMIFAEGLRRTFPQLEPVTEIHTLGILTRAAGAREPGGRKAKRGRHRKGLAGDLVITDGSEVGTDAIIRYLREHAHQREFFPCYRSEHFTNGRLPGLEPRDFVVASRGGAIVGVCAVWDQSGFKQTVVHGYSGWLRAARPLINVLGPIAGMKRLPAPGGCISSASMACTSVTGDDPAIFASLLSAALELAGRKGKDYMLAGFSSRDPLLTVARKHRHILYRSTMYAFSFAGTGTGEPAPEPLFDREKIPYLEIAAL